MIRSTSFILRRIGWLAVIAAALLPALTTAAESPKVLIYSRNHVTNGKGFVHDNIEVSVAAVKELCAEKKIACDVSDDPAVFTPANLKNYRAVIFCNSNNEAFANAEQSKAFTEYIENGGGCVGIHSATGSERNNMEFRRIMGGVFKWHPPIQELAIVVTDDKHPSTTHLPAVWKWKDEGYYCEVVPGLKVLLELDTTSVAHPPRNTWPVKFEGNRFPLAWCQTVGKGRSFYTALGHDKATYADPAFRKHIQGGILWVLDMAK